MPESARLRPALRIWLVAVLIEAVSLGLVSLLRPEWYRSTAYDFANHLISIEGWGIVFALIGVTLVIALLLGATMHAQVRLALALHAVCQFVWGSSILALTFSGSYGAFAGTFQWWLVGAVSLYWAGMPLTIHEAAERYGEVR